MMGIGGMMGGGFSQMPNISQIRERMLQRADANGDQGLSLDEFKAAGQNMPGGTNRIDDQAREAFGRIDSDSNGTVSQDEMKSFGERMSNDMRSMMIAMQSMMGGGGQTGSAATPSGQQGIDPFKEIDSNGDGSLSRAEFDQFGETMRSRMGEGGSSPLQALMQANQAYGGGSSATGSSANGSTDLTATLLKALDTESQRSDRSDRAA